MESTFNRPLPFRRAAVTGATGFVGAHLVTLLAISGVDVRALTRRNMDSLPLGSGGRVELLRGDIRDRSRIRQLLDGVDVVFHTAALVTPWVRRSRELYETNVQGTQWVVETTEHLGIPAVCTSSIVVLDPFPPPTPVRLLDGNHYVRSKRMALQIIQRGRSRGVQVSSVLPSGIVGPADQRPTSLGKQIRQAMVGKAPRLSFGGGLYLIDVRDVAAAHVLAAIKGPGDYALPGEYWPLDRLYGVIGDLSRQRIRQLRVPAALVTMGATILAGWSALKTHEAPVITPAWVYYFCQAMSMQYRDDSEKLGLRPRPVSQALADAVSWFGTMP